MTTSSTSSSNIRVTTSGGGSTTTFADGTVVERDAQGAVIGNSSPQTNSAFYSNNPSINLSSDLSLIPDLAPAGISQSFAESVPSGPKLPFSNPLNKYTSFSCIFTLGVLTNNEINFPDDTYRANGPSILLARNGGTGDKQVFTAFEQSLGITTEYFIDDVEVDTLIAPNRKTRHTNATQIRFSVTEPYSMGMFLQSMATAAYEATASDTGGNATANYLSVPYLLTVEFIGWNDSGNPVKIPETKRMFPLKFTNVDFNVTAGGSQYSVTAKPWHEQALADEVQTIKEDIDIKGETVAELLQIGKEGEESLTFLLNDRELRTQEAGNKSVGDSYVILFPQTQGSAEEQLAGEAIDDTGALSVPPGISQTIEQVKNDGLTLDGIKSFAENTDDMNEIGLSKIKKSAFDSGNDFYADPQLSEFNPGVFDRNAAQIEDGLVRLNFKKGTRIQEIIEEVVLLSEFGRRLYKREAENGFKKWFRIETDVYNITSEDAIKQQGRSPRVYVFRVVLFDTHVSRFAGTTDPSPGIDSIKRQAVKRYDYIYSGKNDDIIDFDIQFDAAFFKAVQADLGQFGQDTLNTGESSTQPPAAPPPALRRSSGQDIGETGRATALAESAEIISARTGNTGGGAQNHPETAIARIFNEAFVNSNVDLVSVELEILGDPYYIADSGMGNYNASPNPLSPNLTSDNTINYQNGDVDIVLNFKTPIDIGQDGFMEFPEDTSVPVAEFSGIYQVNYVTNRFSQNVFTQRLSMIRRPNQTDGDARTPSLVEEAGEEARMSPFASPDEAFGFSLTGLDFGSLLDSVTNQTEDAAGGLLDDVFGGITSSINDIGDAVGQAFQFNSSQDSNTEE
jgi:hypothetical protein